MTWINPLHPDSTPSHKPAWTVRSAGTRGGSAHPSLSGYRGQTQSRFWLKPSTSLPNKAGTCLSFPWLGTKHSRAAWPAWSSSSKNVWDHSQTTSRAIVKQSIGSKDLTPSLKVSRWTFFTKKNQKKELIWSNQRKIINRTFKVCSYFIYKYTFNTKKHWYPSLVNSSVTICIILMIILTNKLHWKINASKILGHNIKKYNI